LAAGISRKIGVANLGDTGKTWNGKGGKRPEIIQNSIIKLQTVNFNLRGDVVLIKTSKLFPMPAPSISIPFPSYLSFIIYNPYFSKMVRFQNQLFYFSNSLPFFTNPLQTLAIFNQNHLFSPAKKSRFSSKSRFSETGFVNVSPQNKIF